MNSTTIKGLAAVWLAGGILLLTGIPAAADNATLLGVTGAWKSFTAGTGDNKVCYTLSQPKASLPKKAKRDPIFLLISDWPARKARAEPEIVPGYKYKDGSTVTAAVGSDKFVFFTKNDGDAGDAWIKGTSDEQRLVESMQKSGQAIVTGISMRGTMTNDTYSLTGLSDALTKIHTACGM